MYTLLRNVHPQPNKHNFRPVILKSNDVDLRSMTFKSDLHNVKMNQSGKICVELFKSNRPDTHTHTDLNCSVWTTSGRYKGRGRPLNPFLWPSVRHQLVRWNRGCGRCVERCSHQPRTVDDMECTYRGRKTRNRSQFNVFLTITSAYTGTFVAYLLYWFISAFKQVHIGTHLGFKIYRPVFKIEIEMFHDRF